MLLLFDEVLNFCNRHRNLAEPFYAFLQNVTVAMTATTSSAAVVSLPRSQVEMTDWDIQWQERITKVVRRVARDLIANDEAEIAEVVRRQLFEDLGPENVRMRRGDMLITALSEATARAGQVDPEEIRKLVRRGVKVYTYPQLHGKAYLFDGAAVVASANLSRRSRDLNSFSRFLNKFR